jgi:hypothetical protein
MGYSKNKRFSDFQAQYNEIRKNMEAQLVPTSPLAYSTDGRTFSYEAPLSLPSLAADWTYHFVSRVLIGS